MTSTASAAPPDLGDVAARVFEDASKELAFGTNTFPQRVRDTHDEVRQAVSETIAAGRLLEADLRELDSKRDLLPGPGYLRLRREAIDEASNTATGATQRAGRALEALKRELRDAAAPTIDQGREGLARDELALLLGDGTQAQTRERVLRIASTGSRDAVGALLSPFGSGLLQARGLEGPDLAEMLDAVRNVIAVTPGRPGATAAEMAASAAYQRVGKLGAAVGASGAYVATLTKSGMS